MMTEGSFFRREEVPYEAPTPPSTWGDNLLCSFKNNNNYISSLPGDQLSTQHSLK